MQPLTDDFCLLFIRLLRLHVFISYMTFRSFFKITIFALSL